MTPHHALEGLVRGTVTPADCKGAGLVPAMHPQPELFAAVLTMRELCCRPTAERVSRILSALGLAPVDVARALASLGGAHAA